MSVDNIHIASSFAGHCFSDTSKDSGGSLYSLVSHDNEIRVQSFSFTSQRLCGRSFNGFGYYCEPWIRSAKVLGNRRCSLFCNLRKTRDS